MLVKLTGLESLGLLLPEGHLEPAPFSGIPIIQHIVRLGVQCLGSFLLKQAGLKRYSGPFDWIFSSVAMVNHCLEDDFKTFLQRSYYRSIPSEERVEFPNGEKCDHTWYGSSSAFAASSITVIQPNWKTTHISSGAWAGSVACFSPTMESYFCCVLLTRVGVYRSSKNCGPPCRA